MATMLTSAAFKVIISVHCFFFWHRNIMTWNIIADVVIPVVVLYYYLHAALRSDGTKEVIILRKCLLDVKMLNGFVASRVAHCARALFVERIMAEWLSLTVRNMKVLRTKTDQRAVSHKKLLSNAATRIITGPFLSSALNIPSYTLIPT